MRCGPSPQPLIGAALCSNWCWCTTNCRSNTHSSRLLVFLEDASGGEDPRACLPAATAYRFVLSYPGTSRLQPRLNQPNVSTSTTLARCSTYHNRTTCLPLPSPFGFLALLIATARVPPSCDPLETQGYNDQKMRSTVPSIIY